RFEPCDDVVYGGLLEQVPGQPDEAQLAADPLLHRFVVIFDREGANHSLLSALWEKRIGAITYRKSVENVWPEAELGEVEVTHPSGERTTINVPNQFPSRSGSLNFER
ncbi:MAG: hypothetical protein LAT83_15580, partial [Kiritimatiellae bacterium]|nr:hypothetical protein [Kiritimatiellia bacterium]